MVIAIMGFITMTMLIRQQQFDSSTLLRSLAYSVALSVRQAQTYGVSVKLYVNGSTTSFAPAYGVYFSPNLSCVGGRANSCYLLFADVNGDGQRADDASEDIQVFNMGKGFFIKDFCATGQTVGTQCYSTGLQWLAVTFRRPNPDACFSTSAQPITCVLNATPTYSSSASIQVTSQGGSTRTVDMSPTGEINVGTSGT
ncbi:MAG: Pili subunit [Candidatus Adlerbacteria bacterium]|nr:Pili subunit [Candidatus Adlerbacteria bacterium]